MKGVILAGGRATRLYPMTACLPKALLPVYDKPMLYYSIAMLRSAGVHDLVIITSREQHSLICQVVHELQRSERVADPGSIRVAVQDQPAGIAHGLEIAYTRGFLRDEPFFFVLSDNLFLGEDFPQTLRDVASYPEPPRNQGVLEATRCWLFLQNREDYRDYGVARLDGNDRIFDVVEKPQDMQGASAPVITGMYYYNGSVAERIAKLRPSARGEYEITDLNRQFALAGTAEYEQISHEKDVWFDLGRPDALLAASLAVQRRQRRYGMYGSPERAAIDAGRLTTNDYREATLDCDYRESVLAGPKC